MKKASAIFLILAVFLTTMTFAGTAAELTGTQSVPVTIRAEGMPLQELLDLLHRHTGVAFAAVPDVSALKVDLVVLPGQTLSDVLALLKERYGLVYKSNTTGTAILLLPAPAVPDRFYMTKAAPGSVAAEANRPPAPAVGGYPQPGGWNTEEYRHQQDNRFQDPRTAPLSTFSIDVDTASYANVRRHLNAGNLPPPDAVRTEELLNYFSYDYPEPNGAHPFSLTTEIGPSPWNPDRKLVLLGLQGKRIPTEDLPPGNLVFLIDVSGSMASPNKLPLLKTAFKMLVGALRPQDRVAIVTYAGTAGVALEATSGREKERIIKRIEGLQAGGSTAGGEGIRLAYRIARENFIEGGNNRVILATDGDFNVGVSSEGELVRLVEANRNDGIALSVLGFGMGNIKDNKMEALADHGNGNYAYIDNALEARKVLVSQMAGTLHTIAKDVKLQVEFNPAQVKAYRLIGYENRILDSRDFNDDRKDAGDMGSGHSVTALYEIIPAGSTEEGPSVDPLVFQSSRTGSGEDVMLVKIRYKQPAEEGSRLMTERIGNRVVRESGLSDNFRFAAAVAEYGMLLRNSEFRGAATFEQTLALARGAKGSDPNGYRSEFIQLLEISRILGLQE